MSEQEEGVSSVVGLMLVLAIVATVLAIYSATYLPGLKQQSEIVHTHEVQDAFSKFGGDIEHAVSQKSRCHLSESFSLGGGDVLLSPGKSSGTLSVRPEERDLVEVSVDGKRYNATLVSITYAPSFSTWELQGYTWQYGYVNVTKGERETPLHEYTMAEVRQEMKAYPFAQSFVEIRDTTPPGSSICTDLQVTLVKMRPGERDSVTGNGMAHLTLNASVSSVPTTGVRSLTFDVPTDIALPEFAEAVDTKIGEECAALEERYPTNIVYDPTGHMLEFNPEVNVTVQTVGIEVNAR
ncbi:hypothetical protein J2129_000781 [Methanofollis sp. W23]|uniref:hypothetical protein n=1 Tax=Methanofollis sp. W23 TaxID=2817849 RepID=UPI001AE0F232|nr:hypothetical protein [Methanofollis sp. W23]MBP2145327.1 hypothetical protein [Methanofollis sp. W23]